MSSIISQRLNAMRKLQENPQDNDAMKLMENSQKEVRWSLVVLLTGDNILFFYRCPLGQPPNLHLESF